VAGLNFAEWEDEGGVGKANGKAVSCTYFGMSSSGVDGWRSVEPLRTGGARLIGDEFEDRKEVGRKGSVWSAWVVGLSGGGVEGWRRVEDFRRVGSDISSSLSTAGVTSEGVEGWRSVDVFRLGTGWHGLVSNAGRIGLRPRAPVYREESRDPFEVP
jgi:hypothetical protein